MKQHRRFATVENITMSAVLSTSLLEIFLKKCYWWNKCMLLFIQEVTTPYKRLQHHRRGYNIIELFVHNLLITLQVQDYIIIFGQSELNVITDIFCDNNHTAICSLSTTSTQEAFKNS